MSKTIGKWGKSLAIRLDAECAELNIEAKDKVDVRIEEGKIVVEKINSEYKVVNGAKFVVKE